MDQLVDHLPRLAQTASEGTLFRPDDVSLHPTTGDSLFEHAAWLYVFCREKLFRDDTPRMVSALWNEERPAKGSKLIEFGCGPGFYSCQFAARFPQISVLGIDRSEAQLAWARTKKRALRLQNCAFEQGDVLALPYAGANFDSLVASRLFTVLPQRALAISEMFRVLRPGGKAFIAEPRGLIRANIPLLTMRVFARLTRRQTKYQEPTKATVLPFHDFKKLFAAEPWAQTRVWQDGRYQYALCQKA